MNTENPKKGLYTSGVKRKGGALYETEKQKKGKPRKPNPTGLKF